MKICKETNFRNSEFYNNKEMHIYTTKITDPIKIVCVSLKFKLNKQENKVHEISSAKRIE